MSFQSKFKYVSMYLQVHVLHVLSFQDPYPCAVLQCKIFPKKNSSYHCKSCILKRQKYRLHSVLWNLELLS